MFVVLSNGKKTKIKTIKGKGRRERQKKKMKIQKAKNNKTPIERVTKQKRSKCECSIECTGTKICDERVNESNATNAKTPNPNKTQTGRKTA